MTPSLDVLTIDGVDARPQELPSSEHSRLADRLDVDVDHGGTVGFGRVVLAIMALGAAIRIAYVLIHADYPLLGDAWVYHHEAEFLSTGHGFIGPWSVLLHQQITPTADHPPVFIVVLALADRLGIHTVFGQLFINVVLGVATVGLIGVIGRRIGGRRVGLVAALIAACYPGLWSWNGRLLSETVATFFVTLAIFFAYRYLDRPNQRDLVGLAAAAVLAGLSRGELILLVPLLGGPLLWNLFRRPRDWYGLVRAIGVFAAVGFVLLGPWAAVNAHRFRQPALFGTGLGRSLDSGMCEGWSGDDVGYWDLRCLDQAMTPAQKNTFDESQRDLAWRDAALATMRQDPARVPVVFAARVGRLYHVYDPIHQVQLDQVGEGREWWVSGPAEVIYLALAACSVVGAVTLRRHRRTLYPLLVPLAIAAVAAMISFGTTRYRATAEPAIVLLAAVGVVAVARHLRSTISVRALLGGVAAGMIVLGAVGLGGVQALHLTETVRLQQPPPAPHLNSEAPAAASGGSH